MKTILYPLCLALFCFSILDLNAQLTEIDGVTEIHFNSTTGSPHLRLLEEDVSPGGSARLSFENADGANRFELRGFLNDATSNRFGLYHNNQSIFLYDDNLEAFTFNHTVAIDKNSMGGPTPSPQLDLIEDNTSDFARLQFSNTGSLSYWHIAARPETGAMNFYYHNGTTGNNVLQLDAIGADLGININPNADLHVAHFNNSENAGFKLENQSNGNWWKFYTSSSNNFLQLRNSAMAGVVGTFATDGTYTASDVRLKENIEEIPYGLDELLQLNAKRYNYISESNTGKQSIGFIAQEVQTILPEIVSHLEDVDQYVLNYGAIGVVAVKSIQEQQLIIDRQQEEIDTLRKEVAELRKLVLQSLE